MTDWIEEELSIEKRNELRKEFSRIGHWQYQKGIEDGIRQERERIINWVITNRRYMELDDDFGFYRDSFNSEDLLRFINDN